MKLYEVLIKKTRYNQQPRPIKNRQIQIFQIYTFCFNLFLQTVIKLIVKGNKTKKHNCTILDPNCSINTFQS
jgi:hypothetical protein